MSWSVYILECNDKTLYTGITTDIQKRIEKHNSGKGAKYTRSRLPVVLLLCKYVGTKSDALKLEAKIKKHKKCDKLKVLESYK
jgi:putative endonuclease